jgi:hypothetical protein
MCSFWIWACSLSMCFAHQWVPRFRSDFLIPHTVFGQAWPVLVLPFHRRASACSSLDRVFLQQYFLSLLPVVRHGDRVGRVRFPRSIASIRTSWVHGLCSSLVEEQSSQCWLVICPKQFLLPSHFGLCTMVLFCLEFCLLVSPTCCQDFSLIHGSFSGSSFSVDRSVRSIGLHRCLLSDSLSRCLSSRSSILVSPLK